MHGECTDDVPVAGYELTLAVLDVGQRTRRLSSTRKCNRRSRMVQFGVKAGWGDSLRAASGGTVTSDENLNGVLIGLSALTIRQFFVDHKGQNTTAILG